MVKIYLQRHTRPDIEPQICYGVSDIPLAPDYRENHLPEVLERLDEVSAKRLYSSPLRRCFTLACDIRREKQIPNITIDRRLMELDFGEWEMTHWNDVYMSSEGKAWFDDFLNTPALGGESFRDMTDRVSDMLDDLRQRGEDAIVVTHSGVIRAALVITGMAKAEEVFGVAINYGDLVEISLE